MNEQQLEIQADKIEMVLSEHRTPARVTGGNVTPRWIQFMVQPGPHVRADRIEGLTREIALALGAPSATVTQRGGVVRIDIPRSDPQVISLPHLVKRLPEHRIPAFTAVMGIADDGAPLLVRLPSPEVGHVLITGERGSGKTSLMVSMLLSLALFNRAREVQIVLIGRELDPLRGLPQVLGTSLKDMTLLMARRKVTTDISPRVIVAIDDLAVLSADEMAIVKDTLAGGHLIGVHIIGATRGDELATWPVKVVASGTPGDFQAMYGNVGAIKFQAAYVEADRVGVLLDEVQHGQSTSLIESVGNGNR